MKRIVTGFSKLSKNEKLELISAVQKKPESFVEELKSYWHSNEQTQQMFDEFSENTISNYYIPYGVAPNFVIDGKNYIIPMVIEESSVIAAASNAAKWWASRGGFHTEIVSTKKIGQVHFIWHGHFNKLKSVFPLLKAKLIEGTQEITSNMEDRGGGILDIELVDMRDKIPNYFQLKAEFETIDSMGANFINSCLEEFAQIARTFFLQHPVFINGEKDCRIIMSILSNYTPDCLVKAWVECDIEELATIDEDMSAEEFIWKFDHAVKIAQVDPHRATTHNKGVFNGIDAVALATGNDFRAIEACGHTYASRKGKYSSLTELELKDGKFKYSLSIPLAMGTVGGLTSLHPMAKRSLEMLHNPTAHNLMRITASVGLANNFGALKSLVTKGIQKGHMKMHLMNILNQMEATDVEKKQAIEHFDEHKVSFRAVQDFLQSVRIHVKV